MIFLYITGLNPVDGKVQEFVLGCSDIESGFDALSTLVKTDCQLTGVRLALGNQIGTPLPISAFDGELMREPLQSLQQQWEEILCQAKE